jgi:ketose-bisphosphate aldolase
MNIYDWFMRAQKENFAIGAFNVANLETFKAIVEAAAEKKSPIIIESSPGETDWMGAENVVDIAKNFQDEFKIPIFVNLDHAETLTQCMEGIKVGYDLIHFDGSALSFDENVDITKQVVAEAHKKGLLVEAEIDRMARKSSEVYKEQISQEELKKTFSDPQKVKEFVEITKIDIMATLFGNIHGIFPSQPALDFELLSKIKQAIPDTFLSLHGGSGIADSQVRQAIEIGKIVKVNINTEMRKAFRETLEDELEENPNEYAAYKIMPDVVESVKLIVIKKIEILGSADKV